MGDFWIMGYFCEFNTSVTSSSSRRTSSVFNWICLYIYIYIFSFFSWGGEGPKLHISKSVKEEKCSFSGCHIHTDRQTDMGILWLIRPRGQFSENTFRFWLFVPINSKSLVFEEKKARNLNFLIIMYFVS